MKLTDLRVANFKCFKALPVKLPKLLILTGANSSGKSTIINALSAVAQSAEYPFTFSPNGEFVTMGDYSEIVHNHDHQSSIEIDLTFADDANKPTTINSLFHCNHKTGAPYLHKAMLRGDNIEIKIERTNSRFKATYTVLQAPIETVNRQRELNRVLAEFARSMTAIVKSGDAKARPLRFPKMPSKLPSEGVIYFRDQRQYRERVNASPILFLFEPLLFGTQPFFSHLFRYISPFRIPPERTYYRKTKDDLKVDKFGVNAIEQLVEWRTRRSKSFKELIDALIAMELLSDLHVKNMKGGRFEIRIVTSKGAVSASLMDVGFGISQFLPVIVADIQAPKEALIAVSQPEIHLHPKTQALYADYIASKVTNTPRRYIIETHSEYIINRLRLKIAKGDLPEDSVALYYLEMVNGNTVSHKINLKKDGQLEGAPAGFFDTYMMDTMGISLEATANVE